MTPRAMAAATGPASGVPGWTDEFLRVVEVVLVDEPAAVEAR